MWSEGRWHYKNYKKYAKTWRLPVPEKVEHSLYHDIDVSNPTLLLPRAQALSVPSAQAACGHTLCHVSIVAFSYDIDYLKP